MPSREEAKKFSADVDLVSEKHRLNPLEAVLYLCEKRNIEIEVAVSMINKHLKKKLEKTANKLRLIKPVKKRKY